MSASGKLNNTIKFATLALGYLSSPISANASVIGGTVGPVSQLETITVQANTPAEFTPWTTRTDREMLDQLQIQDWSEFGRRADPGVNYNKQTQSINVRGLDQSRVTTRIDGIRQPYLNDGARGVKGGLNAFDFNTLWSLGVVRGVDSSAVGSGALGAMLKLSTLSPSDLLTEKKEFASVFKTDVNTQDDSTGLNAAIAGRHHSTEWLVQTGVRQGAAQKNQGTNNGYGLGRSMPDPDDYLSQSYLFKLQQHLNTDHRLGLTGEYFQRNDEIDSRSAQGLGTAYLKNKNQSKEASKRERLSLDYRYRTSTKDTLLDTVSAQLYWQQVTLNSSLDAVRRVDPRSYIRRGDPYAYRYPYGVFVRKNSMSEAAYGLDSTITKTLGHVFSHTLTVGGEWYATQVSQYSDGQDNCPHSMSRLPQPYGPRACNVLHSNRADMPKVYGTQWALWMQDAVALGNTGLTVMPALRYDHYQQSPSQADGMRTGELNNGYAEPSAGGQFSPKLLAMWTVSEQASLYAQYATGFNAPSATQLYSRFGSFGSYLNMGNPNLKPETSRGYEFGLRLGHESTGASLTYFDNNYQNLIESNIPAGMSTPGWQPSWSALYPMGVTTSANIEQARIFGLEARGHLELSTGWRTWASLAWAQGRDLQTGNYLNSVAPLTASLGLGYRQQQWGAHAIVTAVAARTNVRVPEPTTVLPIADYQTPGYGLVDLAAYWRPTAVEGLQVQLGVYNVLDQKYWNALNLPNAAAKPGALAQLTQRPLDFYSEPGRNYRLTVTYQY